ncbi:MAG TPA: helix-turn-helix domain-containing protein [Firmicutes bacterium]|nr:helix-turn-helix domain-containing protein [Bacillota bacterium]
MTEDVQEPQMNESKSREEIGQFLKRMREEKGISLRTVAEETKIRVRYLKALEEGDYANLPGDVYARGFLRSYARFLGVELPRQQDPIPPKVSGEEPKQRTVIIKKRTRRYRLRPGLRVGLLFLLVAIVVVFSFSYLPFFRGPGEPGPGEMGGSNGEIAGEGELEGVPEEEQEEDGERPGRVILVQDTDRLGEYLVTEGPLTLRVRVENSPCWLRVIADGRTTEETLQPGAERDYTAEKELRLRAGNPGGLFLKVNGEELGPAGKPGIPKDIVFTLE